MPKSADKHASTKVWIQRCCRNLSVDDVDWDSASDPKRYNCFGFAVGVLKWWQPHIRIRGGASVQNGFDYWPDGLPCNDTLEAYVKAAESVGFVLCDAGWEAGYEKIVLCYSTRGDQRYFEHAAKQVAPDRWKSKIGKESDFEHPEDIGCHMHGDGRVYMKRSRSIPGDS